MPFTIIWDDVQRTIIRADYTEPLHWEDVLVSQAQFNKEIESVDYRVSLILDFSRLDRLPSGAMSGFKEVSKNYHPRTEFTALVGMNSFIRLFEKTFRGIFKTVGLNREQTGFFAKNLEDARTLIQQARTTQQRDRSTQN